MSSGNIYVGIDLHKEKFSVVMLDGSGRLVSDGSYSTEVGSVLEFASCLTARHQVVLEPLENSYWFVGQLSPYAGSVHLANPGRVRLIAESRLKSDRADARILADLLRVGYLPEVYIPEEEVQRWRCLIQHRIRLVRDRTRLKNRILGLINREGCRITASDPFGKKGRAQFDDLALSAPLRRMVDSNLVVSDVLSLQIAALDEEIAQIGQADAVVQRLCTIDGIRYFTALAIRAVVGRMDRFRNAKAFAAYTGLIPGYRQSAETVHRGSITKQGSPTLRWLLIQAVPHAVRHSPYLRRMYLRLCYRASTAKARVAVAHALARIVYHVWMEARPYYR